MLFLLIKVESIVVLIMTSLSLCYVFILIVNKAQGNSRETWKIINNIRGKQNSKIKPSFIIDGTLVEERRAIANGFNKYFASIASKLNDSDYSLIIEEIPNYTNYIKKLFNLVYTLMTVPQLKSVKS